MKIAFTSSEENINSELTPNFGRAKCFLIRDLQSQTTTIINNEQNLNAAQGAGIQAAQTIARAGVQVLITGHCGPKAFRALEMAGIKVYNTEAKTVDEALERYCSGKLTEMKEANAQGHQI